MPARVYFAHPISSYGTVEERLVVSALEKTGDEVVNPGASAYQDAAKKIRENSTDTKNAGKEVMDYFLALAASCDDCVFLSFSDGKIGAGVVGEAKSFMARGRLVMEAIIRDGRISFLPVPELDPERCLDVGKTREYLRALSSAYARKNPGPAAKLL